jgi:transcriptional regulator with XRE-family HTH domain
MSIDYVIGYTIREIRSGKGLYAMDLADQVPISRSYLSEIEHGHRLPSIGMLADIAKALEMEVSELWYAIYKNLGGKK